MWGFHNYHHGRPYRWTPRFLWTPIFSSAGECGQSVPTILELTTSFYSYISLPLGSSPDHSVMAVDRCHSSWSTRRKQEDQKTTAVSRKLSPEFKSYEITLWATETRASRRMSWQSKTFLNFCNRLKYQRKKARKYTSFTIVFTIW